MLDTTFTKYQLNTIAKTNVYVKTEVKKIIQ